MPQDQTQDEGQSPEALSLGFATQIPTKLQKEGLSGFANLTPEESKAALGMATRLADQYLASQVPQNAPQEGMMPGMAKDMPKDGKTPPSENSGELEANGPKNEKEKESLNQDELVKEISANLEKTIDEKITKATDELKRVIGTSSLNNNGTTERGV